MHSFIFIGKNIEKVRKEATKFAGEQKISKLDIYSYATEKTVGIDDIRNFTKQIFLKPVSSDKKIVILEAFFGMTLEAQNSMLKILEEPPESTTILILANENYFLPTILSRCKLIEIERTQISKDELESFSKLIEDLKTAKIGEKLKLAQDNSKDKVQALDMIEKMIIVGRFKMLSKENERTEYKKIVEVLQKYYKEIKQSNVNLRLALENLFLEI